MLNPNTSNEMPVSNYSVVQPATQQKTFRGNNVCRWSVPFNAIPFFDPHSSYMQIQARCLPRAGSTLTEKWQLNGNSSVVIKYIKFSVNGVVLEEIDEYNCLAQIYSDYGEDESSRAHSAVFNLDSQDTFSTGLMGQASGAVVATAQSAMVKTSKLLIPLKETALFGQLSVVPLMAFGSNLDVEIRFADDTEVLMTYQRGSIVDRYGQMKNGTVDVAGGNNVANDLAVVAQATQQPYGQLPVDNNTTEILGGSMTVGGGNQLDPVITLVQPYTGFTSLGDIPLVVGQTVSIKVVNQQATGATGSPILDDIPTTGGTELANVVIKSIEQGAVTNDSDANVINITLNTNVEITSPIDAKYGAALNNVVIVKTGDTAGNTTFTVANTNMPEMEYSRCELYLQKVEPPAQYVEALGRSISSSAGFQYDLHTFTTYKSNLHSAISSQTIEIPAYQSRAKSVLTVPRRANQPVVWNVDNSGTNKYYSQKGQFEGMRDYQFQVNNGLRQPTRPVNLDVMSGTFKHLAAEHLIQLSQALGASNLGVKSLKESRDDFVIGRQLSKYGATTRLNSALRIYVNYQEVSQPTSPLQTITFLNHINRVSISSGGLQVFN